MENDEELFDPMEGIYCDICCQRPVDRWYRCLICEVKKRSFRLCKNCHDVKCETNTHNKDHPMQCLITAEYFSLYFGGEAGISTIQSFTCPFCGDKGFTKDCLITHILGCRESFSSIPVGCPFCLADPEVHSMKLYDSNYFEHLLRHI